MYLKQIKAQGFKSFADKITIDLDDGITGVVGPNGSGKSNVVDAVRWVLGEQSVKSLRGEGTMTDVIFAGSKSRKPQNVASVTLTFDNMDHYLPIDFNEVALKRRVYKDGSNEYFINGEKCRLKDIVTLLLDSGMAKESFNIISQGKIDEILLSKPTERRTIFEEAAGVLKYKKRKGEALQKLDRTHENMNRVSDIIRELDERIEPLKEQKEKALYYNKVYDELKEIDLSLLVFDIQTLHNTFEEDKKRMNVLKEELLSLDSNNNKGEAVLMDYKNKIAHLEEKIGKLQKDLLQSTTVTEKLKGQKQIILERKKYEVEDHKLHEALIELKERSLSLEADLHQVELSLHRLEEESLLKQKQVNLLEMEQQKVREKRNHEEKNLTKLVCLRDTVQRKIENLKESIDTFSTLPHAVKAVLGNVKLSGIHNTLGNVIEVAEEYSVAMNVALGYATTYVIVENETVAKEAISYLKKEKLGRVTFFPMNLIQGRKLNSHIIESLKDMDGYIGIASDLVKTQTIYQNICENQLGNVIVVDTIDHANSIAKKTDYKYRIVTIEGELLHAGGSITGGRQKIRNIMQDKYDLENALKEEKMTIHHISTVENTLNELDHEAKKIADKLYLANKSLIQSIEQRKNKTSRQMVLTEELEKIQNEMKGAHHLLERSLDEEEEKIMNAYYKKVKEKDIIQNNLRIYTEKKEALSDALEEYELSLRKENSLYHTKSKELARLEVEIGKADVKLDTLLSYLSDTYGMTYEKASLTYHLKMDALKARNRLAILKKECKDIGPVNIDAIEEYDKLAERYEFLLSQREDLIGAENTLLSIVEEMDTIMIKEFKASFEIISKNFEETFTELFHGGYAHLKLTDADNLLETGIEIEASPPGKSLKSISLLSGGEKTFTAISLLFAILKSRPVPFCILDEVEAALDEANVDSFGQYLRSLKEKTQFILITHKKKTMEYADVLYGITMRESGVSKLVSVRLEDVNER